MVWSTLLYKSPSIYYFGNYYNSCETNTTQLTIYFIKLNHFQPFWRLVLDGALKAINIFSHSKIDSRSSFIERILIWMGLDITAQFFPFNNDFGLLLITATTINMTSKTELIFVVLYHLENTLKILRISIVARPLDKNLLQK